MSLRYISCPKCGGVENVERVGPVGRRGVRDSRKVKCTDCNYSWLTDGDTMKEAMGGTP